MTPMAHPPVVHSAVAKLARSDIAGVNVHTLPIALERAEGDKVNFETLNERQVVIALLERISMPESMRELSVFLNVNHALTPAILAASDINDNHAQKGNHNLPFIQCLKID